MMTEFERIVRAHQARYPLMQPQDHTKLAFQSALGPGHMIADKHTAAQYILQEWQGITQITAPCNPEPLGNGFSRFYMTSANYSPDAAAALADQFFLSANKHIGCQQDLEERLFILSQLSIEGMDEWLAVYRQNGCPPVHHSDRYRNAYHPHYRVILSSLIPY